MTDLRRGKRRSPEDPSLRARAEQRLQRPAPKNQGDAQRMIHELDVQQLELELQNEELQVARDEAEVGRERYVALFDFAPVGYALISDEGVIREINHIGARLLGRERYVLVGEMFGAFVDLSDLPQFAELFAKAQEGTEKRCGEVRLRRPVGRPTRLRLGAGRVSGGAQLTMLTLEDVTDAREKQQQLEQTERALREAHRRKDEFLATLSHELRNPLAPIRNSLFVLSRGDPAGEAALRARHVIERQVDHLTRLVDELLDVSRITSGKVRLQTRPVELGDVVRQAMDDHRASFDAAGLTLEGVLEPGLFWIEADHVRVSQVLSNLLVNSCKFTPRGGRVTVSVAAVAGQAVVTVRDTGAGVPASLLPYVFEPFTQGHQPIDRGVSGGLGLGLAMVKGLVELHGGTVELKSEGEGRGTEVRLSLRFGEAPQAAAPVERPAPCPRRVLVIEDNPDSAESLCEILVMSGHEVRSAGDGHGGVELARTFRPDVVICDLGLPGMDGFETARAIRSDAKARSAYLVALSGYAAEEDRQLAAAAGFDRHIAKPPDLDFLCRLVAEAPSMREAAV